MVVSKVMYVVGALAISYVCSKILKVFEKKDEDRGLNFIEDILFRIRFICSIPGTFTFGLLLDYFVDSERKDR